MEVTLDLVKFKVCEGGGKIHISPQLYCLMIIQVYSFFDPQNIFAKWPKFYKNIFPEKIHLILGCKNFNLKRIYHFIIS